MNVPPASRLAASKFCPPLLDSARHLPRTRVLGLLRQAEDRGRRIFFVQARAGQGKTTLAIHFLTQTGSPFAWYQMGTEDQDPVYFCAALLECCRRALAGFRSPLLEAMLDKGELFPADAERAAAILADDLAKALPEKFYLVFDDLHLIAEAAASRTFLATLLAAAPSGLRVLGLSRWPVSSLSDKKRVLVLDNADLALNRAEIVELFGFLDVPLSSELVALLLRRTEGWIMGLVLIGQALARVGERDTLRRLSGGDGLGYSQTEDFFRSEILADLEDELRDALLRLSLFDEIPLGLVAQVVDGDGARRALATLARRNLFVQTTDQGQTYLLHHLFRDALRAMARQRLSDAELTATLSRAADWYLAEGRAEEALHCLMGARDYAAGERLLREIGPPLMARNRLATLHETIRAIPEEVLARHAWLAFFRGIIDMETQPARAHGLLEQARGGFVAGHETLGELLASTQLIFFHLMIDGRFNLGAPLLARAENLFTELESDLAPVMRIQVAHILAMGLYFLYADSARVEHYATLAHRLAKVHDYDNLLAGITITQGYHHAVRGHWSIFRGKAEEALRLIDNPRVSAIHRLFLRLMQLNVLSLEGDILNYHRQRKVIEEIFAGDLLAKTVAGPLFWVLDIDIAIAEGRFDAANAFVQQGLDSGYAGGNAHLRSMYRQYQAFLLALAGRRGEALAAIDESLALREEAGGLLFIAINRMTLGATCVRLGEQERAEALLNHAIQQCEALDEQFTLIGALAFRGMARLAQGSVEAARDDFQQALGGLKTNGLIHFYLASPEILQEFLSAAVRLGIEVDTARAIAARQLGLAILDKGRIIPLLRLRTLGPLVMGLGSSTEVREAAWSPSQRAFWAMLLSAPELCQHQEQVQLGLWPESSTEKSRANFDTLLSRLRRVLDAVCHPLSAKYYLALQRGVLCLSHCSLDAEEFTAGIGAGLRLARQKQRWQAGNRLYRALRLWQGGYLKNISVDDDATLARRAELEGLYLEGVLAWSRLLAEAGMIDDAIEIVTTALKVDPTHHALVKNLYDLYILARLPGQANRVVESYRKALGRADYTHDEIGEIVESLWILPLST